jgi:hypothetical protein
MDETAAYRNLLFQYEILRARFALREHYLTTIVKDVYENIGQMLTLVRVQLSIIKCGSASLQMQQIDAPGKLIGSAIQDLRDMCQRFYPELNIDSVDKLGLAIKQLVNSFYPFAAPGLISGSSYATIATGTPLRVLIVVFETLQLLKFNGISELEDSRIKFGNNKIEVMLLYIGQEVKMNRVANPFSVSLIEKVKHLNGRVEIKKNNEEGAIKIILVIPLN